MGYLRVADHRAMVYDEVRNEAYGAALAKVVTSESVVLDLGAGTGILGLMAARCGARRVYLVEPEDIVSVAAEVAQANGLGDVVRCVQGRIEDVTLPERADLVVSVFTGNFLLAEDLLPSLFYARDHMLRPGGTLIPGAATMEAVPVSTPALHEREIAGWARAPWPGLDFGVARPYAANALIYRAPELRDAAWLAEPQVICRFDFQNETYAGVHAEVIYEATRSGLCHGWLGWFSIDLAGEWLSTSPQRAPMHWSTVLLPLDPPLRLEPGERVTFSLDRAPHADWSWRVRTEAGVQAHSTVLGRPLSAETLRQARRDFVPALTSRGEAARQILNACESRVSVDEMARQILASHPTEFADAGAALEFVRAVVKRYA